MPNQIGEWIKKTHEEMGIPVLDVAVRTVRAGFVTFHVQVTRATLSQMNQRCPRVRPAIGSIVRVMGSHREVITRVYYDVVS